MLFFLSVEITEPVYTATIHKSKCMPDGCPSTMTCGCKPPFQKCLILSRHEENLMWLITEGEIGKKNGYAVRAHYVPVRKKKISFLNDVPLPAGFFTFSTVRLSECFLFPIWQNWHSYCVLFIYAMNILICKRAQATTLAMEIISKMMSILHLFLYAILNVLTHVTHILLSLCCFAIFV